MKTFSIKQKLMLIIMTASTLALLLMAAGSMAYEWSAFRQQLQHDLEEQGEIIGEESSGALLFDDSSRADEILAAFEHNAHIHGAAIYSGTNTLFTWYPKSATAAAFPARPEMGPEHYQFDFDHDRLTVWQPIKQAGDVIGAIYIQSDLQEVSTRLEQTAVIFASLMAFTLAVTFFLSSRLQRVISRPISHLAETVKIVSAEKNYTVRAWKESEDELGQLIDGFNEMIGQIQKRDVALRHINKELEKRVEDRTQDLQQQLVRINLLNQIAYAVAMRQDFQSIILIVLQQLEEHLPADYSAAYFFDEQTELLKVMARGPKSVPLAEQLQIPQAIPINHTPFRSCLQGEMVYVPAIRQLDQTMPRKMSKSGMFSTLGVPLIVQDKVFGLFVLMRHQIGGFETAERDFIRGLCTHVAQAIQQAQLYQDLQTAYNELRQTQQTIMQQERLNALGQMASGVAHDINNALSPIVGFADLIIYNEPNLGVDAKKYLQYIRTAGEDIAHIVSRLQEFYRRRNDRESMLMLDVRRVVEQAIDMTRPRWRDIPQNRGVMIELRTDFSPDVPEFAGIETEIREALTNLILNSVDSMPKGGVITIRTRAVEVGLASRGGVSRHAILEVGDTGVGMNEQTRRRCLEPFFSTKGQRGTGLGLAMVYGVMERHEGGIEIESEPGKGTTMRLIFPVRKIAAGEPAGTQNDTPPGPFHILCIDDEPPLRELIKEMLESDAHHVKMTDGGRAGIEAFCAARSRGEPFDVVITDLGMPYMDGREVASAIKRESSNTPVIVLTGWGAFIKEDGTVPANVDGVLSKPPRIREVRAMLRRVVSKPAAPR